MPNLKVKASRFRKPYNTVNGIHNLPITKLEFFEAAVSVGMPSLSAASKFVKDALPFALSKIYSVVSAIDFDGVTLKRPPWYANLDATEKVNLSYWIGMANTKVVAGRLLDVPWLAHAAPLRKTNQLTLGNVKSRSLPDLIGLDPNGRWHVLDGKCYSSGGSADDRKKWKKQVRQVQAVNGLTVASRSYCLLAPNNGFDVELVDPVPDPHEPRLRFRLDPQSLLRHLYAPYVALLDDVSDQIEVDGVQYRWARVLYDRTSEKNIFIGVAESLLGERIDASQMPANVALTSPNLFIGLDGIGVFESRENFLPQQWNEDVTKIPSNLRDALDNRAEFNFQSARDYSNTPTRIELEEG